MRECCKLFFLICLLALGLVVPAQAQQLIGFDSADFGKIVLKQRQSASAGDVQFELAVGDYNNEPIKNYSPDSVFSKLGKSVGRLDILTDKGNFPCTAFIVSSQHLLTNYHCVPGILEQERVGASQIKAIQFVVGYTQEGVAEGAQSFQVITTPLEQNKQLDYAVLEVIGDPSAQFGKLDLHDKQPTSGDPFWIIGHPMGEAQRISREKCKAHDPAVSQHQMLHTCDTLPGNSGSPVIDASAQKVIGLHHAGSRRNSVNYAIPMTLILKQSRLLRQIQTASLAQNVPLPRNDNGGGVKAGGQCDVLYEEAKSVSACFAYKAYLNQCPAHALAPFGEAYVAENCRTAPPQQDNNQRQASVQLPQFEVRPWCLNGRLNPTETTICSNAKLSSLDAELNDAYETVKSRVSRGEQTEWLLANRDSCGTRFFCIADAYEKRIAALRQLPTSVTLFINDTKDGWLNIRNGPGTQYGIINRESNGEAATLIATNGNWSNIRFADGLVGWAYTPSLSRRAVPKPFCEAKVVGVRSIDRYNQRTGSGFLSVRNKPTTRNSQVITEVYANNDVLVFEQISGWARILCKSGECLNPYRGNGAQQGWASTKFLSISCR